MRSYTYVSVWVSGLDTSNNNYLRGDTILEDVGAACPTWRALLTEDVLTSGNFEDVRVSSEDLPKVLDVLARLLSLRPTKKGCVGSCVGGCLDFFFFDFSGCCFGAIDSCVELECFCRTGISTDTAMREDRGLALCDCDCPVVPVLADVPDGEARALPFLIVGGPSRMVISGLDEFRIVGWCEVS